MIVRTLETPVGELTLFAEGGRLREIRFPKPDLPAVTPTTSAEEPAPDATVLDRTADQLLEYFAGSRRVFELPLGARGTEFQTRVWDALSTIPFGVTTSYGALAESLGAPRAARAVGLANGANPISIVVPCHRVIGANGSLTGFGGGLDRKHWLLRHEGAAVVEESAKLF